MKKTKYVLTIELDLFETSDKEAYQTALNIAKNERKKYDNGCAVHSLHKKITTRTYVKLDLNKLT